MHNWEFLVGFSSGYFTIFSPQSGTHTISVQLGTSGWVLVRFRSIQTPPICRQASFQLHVRSRSSSVLSAMFCRRVRTLQKRHGTNQQSLKRNGGKRGPSHLKASPPFPLCDCHGWNNATDSLALVHPLRSCRVPTRRQNIALKMLDDRLLTRSWKISDL